MRKFIAFAFALSILVSCSDSDHAPADWRKGDLRTEVSLYRIKFANDKVGFVGADQRDVVNTLRGGTMDSDWLDYVNGIHINSDSTIYEYFRSYAYNPSPVLYKTLDGGITWRGLRTPFVSAVVDIAVLDEQNAYVMTWYDGLYKTTDGGESWKRVLSNVSFFGNQQILMNVFDQIYFLDPLKGFAYSTFRQAVVKTTDGGQHWEIDPFFDIQCVGCPVTNMVFPGNDATGYVVSNHTDLMKTDNGGNSWRKLSMAGVPEGGSITGLSFVDKDHGFMVLYAEIYKTEDGGESWSKVIHEALPFLSGTRIHAISSEHFYVYTNSVENPILSVNTALNEYQYQTAQGDGTLIRDWSFVGDKAFVVGYQGLFLIHSIE